MFEDADNERVIALISPPRSRWALLRPWQVETEVLGWGPLHYLLLMTHQHLPADDVQLANTEDYPARRPRVTKTTVSD